MKLLIGKMLGLLEEVDFDLGLEEFVSTKVWTVLRQKKILFF